MEDYMPIIKYTTNELNLLARLMRAEAIGEGNLGMLMVGNVVVNRAIVLFIKHLEDLLEQKANCFKHHLLIMK